MVETESLGKKWNYLKKILERSGPFDTEMFAPSPETLDFLNNTCKILVIGELRKSCNRKFSISALLQAPVAWDASC
jgi:hypothetical protein